MRQHVLRKLPFAALAGVRAGGFDVDKICRMSEEEVRVTVDDAAKSVDLEFNPVPQRKTGQSLQD